jgi:hypothetical protein
MYNRRLPTRVFEVHGFLTSSSHTGGQDPTKTIIYAEQKGTPITSSSRAQYDKRVAGNTRFC